MSNSTTWRCYHNITEAANKGAGAEQGRQDNVMEEEEYRF